LNILKFKRNYKYILYLGNNKFNHKRNYKNVKFKNKELFDSINDNKEYGFKLRDINPLDYLNGLLYDMCLGYIEDKTTLDYELLFKSDNLGQYFDSESRNKINCYSIFRFKDKYYRVDYIHCNYYGIEGNFCNNIKEVQPKEKTIIVYE